MCRHCQVAGPRTRRPGVETAARLPAVCGALNGGRLRSSAAAVLGLLVLVVAACGAEPREAQAPRRSPRPSPSRSTTATPAPLPSATSTPRAFAVVGGTPADGGCKGGGRPPTNGRIAYTATPTASRNSEGYEPPGDIYTVEPDGSSRRRLTHTLDSVQPGWSPDGRRIAYLRIDRHGPVDPHGYQRTQPWVMNADGSDQHLLADIDLPTEDLLGLSPASPASPAWSPDGDSIAVSGIHGITVINVDTGAQRQLDWSVHHWYPPEAPVWSADGKHLLVVAGRKGPGPDEYTKTTGLFTIRSSDGQGVAKVPHANNIHGHDWSTTNCRVVFGSGIFTRGGELNGDLFVTDDKLLKTRLLLGPEYRQDYPTWAPNGRRIAYQDYGPHRQSGLWVADSDGSNAHRIVATFSNGSLIGDRFSDLAWQPVP